MEMDSANLLSDMLQPFRALTPQAAAEVADVRVPEAVQSRIAELAQKHNDGVITEDELAQYEAYVKYGNVLAVIKAQAKKAVAGNA